MSLLNKIKIQSPLTTGRIARWVLGIFAAGFLVWRLIDVVIIQQTYGPDTWLRFAISGLILGGLYALIAIGYTLVYGILSMINFAHGEVMMIGCFGGYFVFEVLNAILTGGAADPKLTFLDSQPVISVILAFIFGMGMAAAAGYFLEKIAYRPLRGAPPADPLD